MSTASAQLESEMQSRIKREGAGRGMEWRRAKSANGRLLAGNTMAQMELEVEEGSGSVRWNDSFGLQLHLYRQRARELNAEEAQCRAFHASTQVCCESNKYSK